jgi:hypothetical protein
MIRRARISFLTRALREKLLLLAFIGIAVVWWGSSFLTRGAGFWRDQRTTTQQLTLQREWIKNRATIEDTAKKTASSLDPARTLNANQLVTTVIQLANEAGLKGAQTSGGTTSTTSGQLALHSQEFVLRNIEWDALTKFNQALEQRSPYIAMERFTLVAAPPNGAQLTLNLKVTSVEITR